MGQLYELTGPRLLTFADAISEITKATGREIRYVRISAEQYAAALAGQRVPPDDVWLLNYLFTEVLDGRNAQLTDGVQRPWAGSPGISLSTRGRPPPPASGTDSGVRSAA